MKQIEIKDVVNLSLATIFDSKRILFTLSNGNSYYANGDVDIVKDVYYCHYEFICCSNS